MQEIAEILKGFDRPGCFVSHGQLPMPLPGLEVDGVATISLPLPESQAKQLIKVCDQAPYGKGSDTVVDTDVRRVWELDPKQFELTNTAWIDAVEVVVQAVQQKLGLEDEELQAELYKLLIYEKGGFFLPHKDSEKQNGMVATCVLTLPSEHTGGELIVRHGGQEEVIKFGLRKHRDSLQYAAFYADCEHEVKPLKSGYRLSLVYNLALQKSKRRRINAPKFDEQIEELTACLQKWRQQVEASLAGFVDEDGSEDSSRPEINEDDAFDEDDDADDRAHCVAISLDHEYTESGIDPDQLKGTDRARADAIRVAAAQAGCRAFVGLVTLWESGYAEGDDDYYGGYSRRRRYSRYSDYEDVEEDDETDNDTDDISGKYDMLEVFDESLTVAQLIDFDGTQIPAELSIDESCFLDPEALRNVRPKEEYEGYTGNAGNTLDRWYRSAVLLIWPESQHNAMLCRAGTAAAVAELDVRVLKIVKAAKSKREALRSDCIDFAKAIIGTWSVGWSDSDTGNRMTGLVKSLGDEELTNRFLSLVVARDCEINDHKVLRSLCSDCGWEQVAPSLEEVFVASTSDTLERNAQLLLTICEIKKEDASRVMVCHKLTKQVVPMLKASRDHSRSSHREPALRDALPVLFKAMLLGAHEDDQSEFVSFLLKNADKEPDPKQSPPRFSSRGRYLEMPHKNEYDLRECQVPAVVSLKTWLSKCHPLPEAATTWIEACREFLESTTAEKPEPPADWTREPIQSCNCADCSMVSDFLKNPDEEIGRFPLAKHRRQCVHRAIDNDHCDTTHTTERRGRPYVLVCRKTEASYQRRLTTWNSDMKQLQVINAILKADRTAAGPDR